MRVLWVCFQLTYLSGCQARSPHCPLVSQREMSSLQQVNPAVRRIRAPSRLQSLAATITREIRQGAKTPFSRVIDVSSGDPQKAGMAPVTFVRQVMAACSYTELLKDKSLPLDVRQRAQKLLSGCNGGSIGSYSATSIGLPLVLKSIAEFIMRRDGGTASDPEHIIFSTGLHKTLFLVLHLLASGEGETPTGVLTPVPCAHRLLSLLEMSQVTAVPYRLMEDRDWALDLDELHRALKAAGGHCRPRALYISNPGNPTGHVQDRATMEKVIHFAATEGLILLVEEAYQDSVHRHDKEFISYKKVLFEMGKQYSDTVELVSFNTLSNAYIRECGLRGGYMEVINMDEAVLTYLKKLQATSCCPVMPQLALEVMVNPPSPGDPSYETYTQEILNTRITLCQNARRACDFLNDLPGVSCRPAMAGVFLYPRLQLPPLMIEEAKMLGMEADVLYCQKLLEEEGVCMGAGFENGQKDQTYHIRLCVLAPPTTLDEVLARLRSFHLRLLDRFP